MKKNIKNWLVFAAIVAVLALGANAYAEANNCTWHYSWYINEEPVCK